MSGLNMEGLKVFLSILMEHRLEEVRDTQAWRLYGPALEQRTVATAAWNKPKRDPDAGVAEALYAHLACGRSLREGCWAMLRLPGAEVGTREAARKLLQAIQPIRDSARALTQALDGARDRERLEEHLRLMPRIMTGWFRSWLKTGEALGTAVAERHATLELEERVSGDFFGNTVALVGAFRLALKHEAAFSPHLSERLDSHVFGLWDSLRRRKRVPEARETVAMTPVERRVEETAPVGPVAPVEAADTTPVGAVAPVAPEPPILYPEVEDTEVG